MHKKSIRTNIFTYLLFVSIVSTVLFNIRPVSKLGAETETSKSESQASHYEEVSTEYERIKSKKDKLVMGFVPLVEQDKLIDSLDPLSKILSEELNAKVEAFTASNYVGVIEALGSGRIDFAIIPPLAYVLAHQENGAELLLSAVNKEGKSSYRSQFIVSADSSMKTIKDVKDHIIGFVDPASSSGYVYPAAFLKKNDIDLDNDIQSVFCGGHDAAIEQLLQGDVDIACTYDDARKKMEKDYPDIMKKTKVLAYSDDIPYIALVANKDLDDQTKLAIKHAVMNKLNDGEGKKLISELFNLYGFKEASDSDYDSIRDVAKLMDIKIE